MASVRRKCCCCNQCVTTGGVGYSISANLTWPTTGQADLDLYARVDSGLTVYFDRLTADGLTLNHDVYPICIRSGFFDPPELISSTFYTVVHTFKFWYSQYSTCASLTPPTVKRVAVANGTGRRTLCVNGQNVGPGCVWTSDDITFAGYNSGEVDDYDATHSVLTVEVVGACCP